MTTNKAFDDFILTHFGTARHHLTQQGNHEILLDCPKCGARQRCCLNPVKRKFNCYRCGGGNLIDWLVDVASMKRGDAYRLVKGTQTETLEGFDHLINQFMGSDVAPDPATIEHGAGIQKYIQEFIWIGHGDATAELMTKDFLAGRGFSLEEAKLWRLMYAPTSRFSGRLIIPVIEDGKVVYFQGRSLSKNDDLKYLNPGVKDGCWRDHYVWNIDTLTVNKPHRVFVTEGAFNAMSIGLNTCSMFGKHVSEPQSMKLRSVLPQGTELIFAFDYGAEYQAWRACTDLSGWFKTRILLMPDKRDLNDWYNEAGTPAVDWLIQHNLYEPEEAYSYALAAGRIKPGR